MEEKISVILPVYNVEPWLERCMASIVSNTYGNLEIICVNDGSTDGCAAILEGYAREDARIRVISRKNGGLSAARNTGLEAATGDYIVFLDSDDWIHPQYFEVMMALQKRGNYDLVICGHDKKPETPTEWYDPRKIEGEALDLEGIYRFRDAKSYVWNKLYKRELIGSSRFVEGVRIAEDAAFNALVLSHRENLRACRTDLVLYHYVYREGSLAGKLRGKETLDLGQILLEYALRAPGGRGQAVCLLEALKRGFSSRYVLSQLPENRKLADCSGHLIRTGLQALWKCPEASLRDKARCSVFAYLPGAYRLFRIMDDPTLLNMEKQMKKERG